VSTGAHDPAALAGRGVVVTGVGQSGQVGEIVARTFGSAGAVVHCVDRGPGVHDRVAELSQAGIQARGYQTDLTDFAATSALAERVAGAHGGQIAAVAALAGGFAMSGLVAESDPEVLSRQIAINLTSAYATARAFIPGLRAGRGTIVFVTSAAVLPGGKVAGMSAYAMAKGGLVQLARAVAQEERDNGVRAYALAPTALRTTANLDSMGSAVRYVEREELADTIVALCGPAFRRITGQVLELA
jgi:3-oxoacyl-[acyl-carrier protein] reductase